jgi:hypothetical protein
VKSGFVQRVLLAAALFWLACQCLNGAIFLFSHLPPTWLPLERPLKILGLISRLLTLPRQLLRHLWPSEQTPTGLNLALSVLNFLIWGLLFVGGRKLKRRSA